MPPLFISIPAQIQGKPFGSRASGSAQLRNIRSWRAVGFVPVPVNTADEHNLHSGVCDASRFLPGQRADFTGLPAEADGGQSIIPTRYEGMSPRKGCQCESVVANAPLSSETSCLCE